MVVDVMRAYTVAAWALHLGAKELHRSVWHRRCRRSRPATPPGTRTSGALHDRAPEHVEVEKLVRVVSNGVPVLLDTDEFEEHRLLHASPESHVRAAEQAAQFVQTLIAAGTSPFDGSHIARMSRMSAPTTD